MAGQQLRGVLDSFVRRHPHTLQAADGDPAFAGTDVHTVNLLRSELASYMGVCNVDQGISKWWPGLVKGYVEMARDPEMELPN